MVRKLMTRAPGSSPLKDPLVGQVIQGRYRIRRAIGSGGMGVVYEAEHLLIGRKVAVKVLTARGLPSNAGVVRFRREAQAAASVGNSHVVDVLDMGQLDDGSLYIVLEHLDGVHLGWAVAQSGPFSVSRAIHVMCQLCDALSAVHAAGIVHRDLKPENIFLIERDGEPDFVKVLDFGVCRVIDAQEVSLTASGDMVGTPLFMAPEQVDNESSIDHRIDVYALGALMHFLLTGRAPFDGTTLPKLFMQICAEPPPSVRAADASLPAELDAIVGRALSKSPDLRFESCTALKRALLTIHESSSFGQARRRDELAVTLPVDTVSVRGGAVGPGPASRAPRRLLLRGSSAAPMAALAAVALAAVALAAVGHAVWPADGPKRAARATEPVLASVHSVVVTSPRDRLGLDVKAAVSDRPSKEPAIATSAARPRPAAPRPAMSGVGNARVEAPGPAPAEDAQTELEPGVSAEAAPPQSDHAVIGEVTPGISLNRGPKRGL
jgi:eukaryotic-like serine/threonine-protein kinase